jgi:predicted nucleotidyltransferase component of viral defense system
MHSLFSEQVKLLVHVLPHVAKEECFALKGGTAINLFIRDLPRLSVDIDLAYVPLQDREKSLIAIDAAMRRISKRILQSIGNSEVHETLLSGTKQCIRLLVKRGDTMIKIEVTPVLRGSVHPIALQKISEQSESFYGSATMQLLSFEDLYGGKLCAALDRQHPRDLFDVYHLMHTEGISTKLKDTFLIYLLSHNRPMSELLNPRLKDISALYQQEFEGMTRENVSLEVLLQTRVSMIHELHRLLDANDKAFLLSIKQGNPQWNLSPYKDAAKLPAVQWKLHNLSSMSKEKRQKALQELERVLMEGPNV